MKASALIRKAIDILETDGWCKYQFIDQDGKRCSGGALLKAAVLSGDMCRCGRTDCREDSTYDIPAYEDARKSLHAAAQEEGFTSLIAFNDIYHRTYSEVRTLMVRTANFLEGEGQ